MYRLRELMKKRPGFGMTIYTGSPVAVEVAAAYGMDYLFIDAEHTPLEVTDLKNLVLTAQYAGISALVRVAHTDEVEIRKVDTVLGKDTVSSMQAGIYYGYIGQTEYVIRKMKEESGLSDIKVVATGGLGKLISEATDAIDIYDPELTLHGLRIIYDKQ